MIETLQAKDFSPHLNKNFRIHTDSETSLEFELVEVTERELKTDDGKATIGKERVPFSIVFRATDKEPMPQGIYKIEHSKMGKLELFLVPIGPDEKGMLYEAVFN